MRQLNASRMVLVVFLCVTTLCILKARTSSPLEGQLYARVKPLLTESPPAQAFYIYRRGGEFEVSVLERLARGQSYDQSTISKFARAFDAIESRGLLGDHVIVSVAVQGGSLFVSLTPTNSSQEVFTGQASTAVSIEPTFGLLPWLYRVNIAELPGL